MVGSHGVELVLLRERLRQVARLGALRAVAGRHPLPDERRPGCGAVAEGPAAQRLSAMWCQPAGQNGSLRHDAGWVDIAVHEVVVLLDLDKVDGVAETGGLEQVAGVG